MLGANERFARAYRGPAAPESTDRPTGIDHDTIVARIAIGWLGLMLILHATSTAVIEWELVDPQLSGTIEVYTLALHLHSSSRTTLSLPLAMGIASMLVLRKAVRRRATELPWLGYVGLAGWAMASIVALAMGPGGDAGTLFDPSPPLVPTAFLIAAALSCGMAAVSLNAVHTLWTRRRELNLWHDPMALGIGVGAALQLVAFVRSIIHVLGNQFGLPTLGSGLVTLDALVYPVGFGLAFGLLEPSNRERTWIGWALLAVGGYEFLPHPGWGALLPMFGVSLAVTGVVRFVGRGPRNAAGCCACAALVSLGLLALIEGFLLALSTDVHLWDTTFMTLVPHLGALALLLVVLGWALAGRVFASRAVRIASTLGVLGLASSAMSAFVVLGALGQQGLPRYYVVYIDMFASQRRFVAYCAAAILACLVGLVIVVLGGSKSRDLND